MKTLVIVYLDNEEANDNSGWDIRRCDPADTDGSGRQRFSLVGHVPPHSLSLFEQLWWAATTRSGSGNDGGAMATMIAAV